VLHNSKPNISLITYFRHGNQKLTTQFTQKKQKKHVLNMRENKHPLIFSHSRFPNFRWIVGELGFLNMLCTWIFPTMKQQFQVITF
jgi:hypothetical protein